MMINFNAASPTSFCAFAPIVLASGDQDLFPGHRAKTTRLAMILCIGGGVKLEDESGNSRASTMDSRYIAPWSRPSSAHMSCHSSERFYLLSKRAGT